MTTRPAGTPDVDLTFDGASGTVNGGVFMTGQFQLVPDHFSSFLEIRNNGVEQGYNTNGTLQYNTQDVQNSTHSVLLANVPIVIGDGSHGTEDGVAYREFRLNLGEAGTGKQYLSLDAFQIWQEESGSLTNFTAGSGFTGAHTNYLAYNLDAGGDHWIGLQEPENGNGANQTEFTILIPDSAFINDPAHRYVTLFSKFGMQAGWQADSGSEVWGLSVDSSQPTPAMTVHKTATVPGGTANSAGEVISYSITVANVGDVSLTGITVTDPSVSNLSAVLSSGFNVGDTNHDNQLSAGETWQYTASYTVTQNDINTLGGGDGFIDNTVTADSVQTNPVSASASVVVENSSSIAMTKTADVSAVHAAGDVVHYNITVANTGNAVLTGLTVTDPQFTLTTPILDLNAPILGTQPFTIPVLAGDYNIGDTNQNGFQDPGETFQFVNVGDTNQNGVQDPGETFQFANAGDTNHNGSIDPGETFQYYNAGDTNHNGVEDAGETFQFLVSHQLSGVDANHDGFNDGDTNHDGALDLTETWAFSVNYTVTQDDIDNGGIVDPALTHSNTASGATSQGTSGSASASVAIVQNPHVTLVKTASVADGTADAAGDVITYAIAVTNDGNMTLTSPVVSDPSVSNLTYVSGDLDSDGKIDVGETWHYTANHTVTQAEIDNGGVVNPALAYNNTASVTTAQGTQPVNADPDANDTGSASVPIVQNPHVTLVKSASVADGTANAAGDVINYTINVTNDGNMTLTSPVVSDPSVSNLAYVSGDLDSDGKLDLGETWHYTANHTVTQADIDNGGLVNPALTYSNTASVTTAQGASDADANDSDTASVAIVQDPHVTLAKAATVVDGTADAAGDVINYTINVTNDGNMTLTSPVVSDPSVSNLTYVSGDADSDGKLDLGETWHYTANHTVTQADIDNGGVVNPALTYSNTASVTTAQGAANANANDSDTASVAIVQSPHVVLDKTASVPGGTADSAGEVISYAITVTNDGNMTLTNPVVSDASVSDLAPVLSGGFNAGDLDQDGKLDLGEVWQYSASHTVTQAELNAGGSITNTASVSTDQGASSSDSTSVTVVTPPAATLTIDDDSHISMLVDVGPTGPDAGGDLIQFFFTATNHTGDTLTSFMVSDTQGDIPGSLQNPAPSSLGPNGVFGTTFNHILTGTDVSNGYVDDDVTVSAIDPSTALQTATLHFHFLL